MSSRVQITAMAVAFMSVGTTLQAQALPAGVTERPITVPGPVALPGTLTTPVGKGPFPVLVLVHGSGAGDRDETLYENRPFRDIAWGLAARGIVVLRYDKRAHVQPGWYAGKNFTVYDEAVQDALAALILARQQPEVDARRSFMLGHSLGGMLAPRIAAADPALAGLVIAAGATRVRLIDQMTRQVDEQFANTRPTNAADSGKLAAQRVQVDALFGKVRALKASDSADNVPIAGLGGTGTRYWLDLASYDPAAVMRGVHKPILVLQGMRDYQVAPGQVDDWVSAVGPRNDLTVKRYSALTHLLIAGSGTPGPQEYLTPGHVDTQLIDDLAMWLKLH